MTAGPAYRWLDQPAQWEAVARAVRAAGKCGSDSETYGHDVSESTPTRRAWVHVWSVALLTGQQHPRGHRVAAGVVMPVEALTHPEMRDVLEDPRILKVYHNAPHDVHSKARHGVRVAGWRCSLARARIHWAGLPGYGAKQLGPQKLGRQMSSYEDTVSYPNVVDVQYRRRVCACGADAGWELDWDTSRAYRPSRCNKRSRGHDKREEFRVMPTVRGVAEYPLESIVPGHPRHAQLVDYAGEDAVVAAELWDLMDYEAARRPKWVPPVTWAPDWRQE